MEKLIKVIIELKENDFTGDIVITFCEGRQTDIMIDESRKPEIISDDIMARL